MNDAANGAKPDGEVPVSDDADPDTLVLYEMVEPHICRISLNRPHRRNAMLTPEMNDVLLKRFEQAQDDDEVKVIILTGVGGNLCAGEDTARVPVEAFGMKKGGKLGQSRRMRGIRKMTRSTHDAMIWSDKVTIAACPGYVLGLGFTFAMTADLLILADDAVISRKQARIGLAGFELALPLTLMRLGLNRGMELLLTGRTVTPQELKDWGVANSVVPADKVQDEALRYARAVAALSTDGLLLGKRAYQQFLHGMGLSAFQNFASVGHPLFTNLVWRDDEVNFLRERDKEGGKQAMQRLNKIWDDLGFE